MLCGLIMLLLVVIAEARNWGWTAAWQSILVNLGTSLLLAAVVFLAEPRFTRSVAQAAGQGVTREVRVAVAESTGDLTQRLDDLESTLLKRKNDETTLQQAVVNALREDISQRTISRALEEAEWVGAVSGEITVRGTRKLQDPGVVFRHVRYNNGRWSGGREGEGEAVLELSVEVEKRQGEVGTPVIACDWTSDRSAADVDAELRRQLKARGYWDLSSALDLSFALKEFARGIDLALASSRSASADGGLKGALIRLVDDNWAITEAGIECPAEKYLLPESEFPEKYRNVLGPGTASPFLPAAPPFVDDDTWSYVVEEGKKYLPRSRGRIGI